MARRESGRVPVVTTDRLSPAARHRLLVGYVLGMLVFFLVPVPDAGVLTTSQFDKLVHAVVFCGFARLHRMDGHPPWRRTLLAAFLLAAGIEVVQSLTPYRSGDLWDCVAGVCGAVLGLGRSSSSPGGSR